MIDLLRVALGGALLTLCLGLVWLLPCYLAQRRSGEISGWLAVPALLGAIGIWVVLLRLSGIVPAPPP
jgi:hypothetical protein